MLDAVRPVRVHGAKGAARQVWETLHWGARLIATPNDYRTHRLYLKGVGRKEALRFLSGARGKSSIWRLNRTPEILDDKIRYASHFGALGLPVPPTVAVIGDAKSNSETTLTSPEEVTSFLTKTLATGRELAIKPLDAWEGDGVTIVVGIDGDNLVLSNGDRQPLSVLVNTTATGVWIVQERIIQHPDLAELNASTLNSLRVGTFRRNNGNVEIVFAVLRIGRAYSQIDAYNKGGYSIRLDPVTGAFADHAFQKAKFSLELQATHGDSEVSFKGRTYPYWDRVVSMSKKFAAAAADNRFVGWDVAATPSGPVFVEGNHNWDIQLAQIGSRGMLTDDFVRMLQDEAQVTLDPTRMPPLRPGVRNESVTTDR